MRPERQQGGYAVQGVAACRVITISPASLCQLLWSGLALVPSNKTVFGEERAELQENRRMLVC